jgi:Na+/H+ antiporter NhaD/arsenite permease-like protein
VPIEFVLFGLTLTGVAIFHHHTLAAAVSGLAVIIAYQLLFSEFPAPPDLNGLVTHLSHAWVIIANLACLLLGFAILSRHFEKRHVPLALPRLLPTDWKGCFALLAIVFVLSSFLDNIAAAMIGDPPALEAATIAAR